MASSCSRWTIEARRAREGTAIKDKARFVSFVGELVEGNTPAATHLELESLLHWLAGRRNRGAAAIGEAFELYGISRCIARKHTLSYLDRALFVDGDDPHRVFGLEPGCDLHVIRPRHRQLLQIFHPDRHAQDRDWFTARTEQLNASYAALKERDRRGVRRSPVPRNGEAAISGKRQDAEVKRERYRRRSRRRTKDSLRRSLIRNLGDAAKLEKHVYVGLAVILLSLLTIVYLSHPRW